MNGWIKHITNTVVTGALATSLTVSTLNKEGHVLRVEPERVLVTKAGVKVLIRTAEVWGDPTIAITEDSLIKLWNTKTRKVPLHLMLAKAYCESGFKPAVMRYEMGQHQNNIYWKGYNEFQATSGGLFQIMGFNLNPKYCKDTTWSAFCLDYPRQLNVFDDFMGDCLVRGRKFNNGKDSVYKAIACYGGNPRSENKLCEINYSSYEYYKWKYK